MAIAALQPPHADADIGTSTVPCRLYSTELICTAAALPIALIAFPFRFKRG
jgi:hypothetical protein